MGSRLHFHPSDGGIFNSCLLWSHYAKENKSKKPALSSRYGACIVNVSRDVDNNPSVPLTWV